MNRPVPATAPRSAWRGMVFAFVAVLASPSPASAPRYDVLVWKLHGDYGSPPILFRDRPLPSARPMWMVRNVNSASLYVFRPRHPASSGPAVIICPGGGGILLDWENEGTRLAAWLAGKGLTAAVLRYRLYPTPESQTDFKAALGGLHLESGKRLTGLASGIQELFPVELIRTLPNAAADAGDAVALVRSRAKALRLDSRMIGLLGFSWGGYVAAQVALEHDASSRPDFFAAIYGGTRGDLDVPSDAPPLFAAVAQDDVRMAPGVVELYRSWTSAHRPAELHAFAKGGHGFGTIRQGLPVDGWVSLFYRWLRDLS